MSLETGGRSTNSQILLLVTDCISSSILGCDAKFKFGPVQRAMMKLGFAHLLAYLIHCLITLSEMGLNLAPISEDTCAALDR